MVRLIPVVFLAAAVCGAQESTAALENPFTSDADVARGERTFLSQCASCHGRDGRGGSGGPDVSTGRFRRASSDEGLFQIISKGVPGTNMPAFALNAGPTWQVVAYLRSLGRARQNQSAAGHARRGEPLYKANCARCHESGGPDLTGVGARRAWNELRQAVLDPQAEVSSQWWRMKAVLRDGRTITGVRLNEDTFSMQLRDGATLRSLLKSEVRSLTEDRTSPMPSFQGKLSDAQLDDILAYVVSRSEP